MRSANTPLITGMFKIPYSSLLNPPWWVTDRSVLPAALKASRSGCLVMKRIVPPIELAP